MVGSSSSEDRARSRRGGFAGHHKPIRSRHQQFVSLVCRRARDQEFLQDLQRTSTACQSRHSPSRSTREGEEARESSGSHVRRGGASCRRPPCRVEEGSKRRRGASVGRRWSSANLSFLDRSDGWQSWTNNVWPRKNSQPKPGLGWRGCDGRQSSVAQHLLRQNVDSELTRLRAQVVELRRAATPALPRTAPVWMGDGPPLLDNVPLPMSRTWNIG